MNRLLLIFTIGLITINSFSQNNCSIEKEYQKIFKIEKEKNGKRKYLTKTINNLDRNSCFSDLVNNNKRYINYLLTHFSDNSNYEELMTINNKAELQSVFIKSLENDSAFNNVMNKLTEKITDKSQFVPDTISMDELLNTDFR